MPLNLSAADPILKDFYEGAVREAVNQEVTMFRILQETDRPWSGRRVVFPFHTARNAGVGARQESATLPSATNQGYALCITTATFQYGRFEISGPALEADPNTFASTLQAELDGITRDLINDLGRQTHGTADGRIAQIGTSAASNSVVSVFNRFFEPGQPGARYIAAGQRVQIGTEAAPESTLTARTVIRVAVSQNPATTSDTFDVSISTVNTSSSDHFVFNHILAATNVEMNGLLNLIDDISTANWWDAAGFASAVQGISRSDTPAWNSLVLANSGVARVLDGFLLQTAWDRIVTESGMEPDAIIAHHDTIRALLENVSADRRYVSSGGPVNYDAGRARLTYNGIELMADRHAAYNSLFMFKRDILKLYTYAPLAFANRDGAILARVSNTDQYEGFVRFYGNIGFDKWPRAACRIQDIRVDL